MKIFFSLILFASSSLHIFAEPLSDKQQNAWLEDIDFFYKMVKEKHISPFHTLSENEFEHLISMLKKDITGLSEPQVEARLMAITGAIGDGHSNYFMMSGPHQHYPFRYKFFDNTLRIVDTNEQYRHLLGSELKAINGKTVDELFKIISPMIPGVDNQFSAKASFEFYLTLHKLLLGLELVSINDKAAFKFDIQGHTVTEKIAPIAMNQFGKLHSEFKLTQPRLSKKDIGLPGITLSFLNNNQIAYFDFKSYPSFEQITKRCKSIQGLLKKAKSEQLIVDFRGNGGGNFYAGLAFSSCLLPLDQFDWQHGIYVLIDGHTFSAAMSNAVQFKQILNARVIGMPTGGDPNHFSESYRFVLPNSKRHLSLSKRYYPFVFDETDALYPDQAVKITWQDYKHGKDTVLLTVLDNIIKN